MCLPQRKSVGQSKPPFSKRQQATSQKALLFHTKTAENTPSPNLPQPLRPTNFSLSLTDSSKNYLSNNIHHQHDESTELTRQPPVNFQPKKKVRWGGEILGKIPRKLQHTLRAHPNQSPKKSTMKGIPLLYSLLVKVALGVFQRCVETTFWGNF